MAGRTDLHPWQRVVAARRLYAKGDGWWAIALACGHKAMVLHGAASPLGEDCWCFWRCGEPPSADASDPHAADPGNPPTRVS